MIVCGVKMSHDGGVALIEGSRLRFSIEIEKLDNHHRYSDLGDVDRIGELLGREGCGFDDVDIFVIDGWSVPPGCDFPVILTRQSGRPLQLRVAPYTESDAASDCLERYEFDGVKLGRRWTGYVSYHHATSHLLAAYCTSPFAKAQEDALVLVWDGGMPPRLYRVDGYDLRVDQLGSLFPLAGNVFAYFCSHFEPFWRDTSQLSQQERLRWRLEIAGKAMAYAALGVAERDAFRLFQELLDGLNASPTQAGSRLGQQVADRRDELFSGMSNADLIATFEGYLGEMLLTSLQNLLPTLVTPGDMPGLCLSGGCALNIKWNSLLRESGLFREVWVPPFPNDSGAAIGAACCEMVHCARSRASQAALEWDVYLGPTLGTAPPPFGWTVEPCDEARLAELLHAEGDPVVALNGRAELGPRALGNRSILACPTQADMKDRLNQMKGRESYRPIAPICLESRAREVFSPGTRDPFMLFDQRLRPGWAERIPAVVHLDGTARLQTINREQNPTVARILEEYERLSGVPVLCNTSANRNGRGFFSDVRSAAKWGRARYIWSSGQLFRARVDKEALKL